MARLPRVIIPGIPHHITQRGNRRQQVFFRDDDRQYYLQFVLELSRRYGVTFLAYCLMDNHVHFIAVPQHSESVAHTFGEAHRRYTRMVNERHDWTGHLWQGRFASCPLDEPHLFAAMRYVERNPVAAGMVQRADAYPWSSARAHAHRMPDPLLTASGPHARVRNWARFLGIADDDLEQRLERHSETGRPFGDVAFVERLERLTGRQLQPRRVGRKRKK